MRPTLLMAVLACLCFMPFGVIGQEVDNCDQVKAVMSTLDRYHFKPINYSAHNSEYVFSELVSSLDPYRLYFLEEDLKEWRTFEGRLLDAQGTAACQFVEKVATRYEKRLQEVGQLLEELEAARFDWKQKDSLRFSASDPGDHATYSSDKAQLKLRWTKWLKLKMLSQMSDSSLAEGSPPEAVIVQEIFTREKCRLDRMIKRTEGSEQYVMSLFLHAVALTYDPHSAYFSAPEKENFEVQLSAEAYSIGLDLTENENGELLIARLVPGGPAWKSNELHQGDVLKKISSPGGKQVEILCMSANEVEALIMGGEMRVSLTVKKANGQEKEVVLLKEKLVTEDNIIKSFILDGPQKVGFIALPGFYTEWEDNNPLGCANDVAKEILKLQKEGIKGLVLDLRNNGGGSLLEAIELVGIFIDEGPVGIMHQKEDKPRFLKDMNRGSIYRGPLVVLVNGYSASASELVSAALRDRNRAIIVGTGTYGKFTSQVVLPVEGGNRAGGAQDFVKVTTGKIYGVNGGSAQQRGVQPHIVLPDPYDAFYQREIDEERALENDSVIKKLYFTLPPKLPAQELARKSAARTMLDSNFIEIVVFQDSIEKLERKETIIPLNPDGFYDLVQQDAYYSLGSDLQKMQNGKIKVINHGYNEEVLRMDNFAREASQRWIDNIQEDIYIDESYWIVNDMIDLTR